MSKLTCIVDGNNILLRSSAAMKDLTLKDGTPIGGAYGFIATLMNVYRTFKFTDLIVAFDWGRSVFRSSIREEYKAKRVIAVREDAAGEFKLVEEFLDLIQVPFVRVEGIEADDIIASLAPKLSGDVIILSADHDLLQLVSDNVNIVRPTDISVKGLVGPSDVFLKYGLPPERLAELWAIGGDAGDGIEGIPRVGPKTSLKIVQEYGSLWDAVEECPKLIGYEKRVLENYTLIDLVHGSTGISINNDFNTKFNSDFYPESLRKYLTSLEMFSLVRKFDQRQIWQ